ncbi:MAG: DUF4159 domain-containing protein [Planctomycetes bacterium]|nr:DUF4159 domain-containing protein [Planctomycetota bacterium]
MKRTTVLAVLLLLGGNAAAADGFSDEKVAAAIDKAAKFLLSRQNADGSWRDIRQGGLQIRGNERQVGVTSLVTFALLSEGMRPSDPPMAKALKWLGSQQAGWTYAVSLRCEAWFAAAKREPQRSIWRRNLAKDARMLILAAVSGNKPKGSYGYRCDPRTARLNDYDNSNGQYGVLGVWAARQLNMEVPRQYWLAVMNYWQRCQKPDGGWSYKPSEKKTTGSMTAAGLATMFVCVDAVLGPQFIQCRRGHDILALRKGLDWFDRNFVKSLSDAHLAHGYGDIFYYLFGVERVGLACGYKYFGKVDWYRRAATLLLAKQAPNGAWRGQWGEDVATAYALLFLVRGQHAVLFNWLEYDGDWNNRPRALANFCRWARGTFERDVSWQIINLKAPVGDWHDAPCVLITGSRAPKFSRADLDKLRTFVYQGGTIVSIAECAGREFDTAVRKVYAQLFPDYPLREVPPDDDLYDINARLGAGLATGQTPKLWCVSNGPRRLVVHTDGDLTRNWQLNNRYSGKAAFDLAANIVMYVTDRQLRNRGAVSWPAPAPARGRTVKVARLKYKGNWNPEPLAWQRFARLLGQRRGIRLEVTDGLAMTELPSCGAVLAVLTGTGALDLSAAEKDAVKKYVQAGGTILIDAAGGTNGAGRAFSESAEVLLVELFGRRNLRTLSEQAQLYRLKGAEIDRVHYTRKTRMILASKAPRLKAVLLAGRPAVIFSREDLTTALVGVSPYGIDGYTPESAYEIVRNVVMYAGKVQAARR